MPLSPFIWLEKTWEVAPALIRVNLRRKTFTRGNSKLYQKKYMLSPPSIWQEKSREVAPEVGRWICVENIHVIEKE